MAEEVGGLPGLDVSAEPVEGPSGTPAAIVVRLSGELDLATARQAAKELRAALRVGAPVMVVDTTGLTFFGAAGLNVLLELRGPAREQAVDLRLVVVRRTVFLPLRITGVGELFRIHRSVPAALAAAGSHDPDRVFDRAGDENS